MSIALYSLVLKLPKLVLDNPITMKRVVHTFGHVICNLQRWLSREYVPIKKLNINTIRPIEERKKN